MTRLTFEFHDPRILQILPATVTVSDGGGQIFAGALNDGDTFEVTADIEGNLFIGNQITISILLDATVNITTSCATPIFVGDTFGAFEVVAGKSMGNVSICCAPEDVETVPPVIVGCPSNITTSLSSSSCTKVVNWIAPTANDNCGAVTLTPSVANGSAFPLGPTTVTYTATDQYGNTATCSFTVQVNDIHDPVIFGCPASPVTANAVSTTGICGTNVTWTAPTVTDNCTVNMTSNKSPGDFFPVGTTPVTYTATDASGRTATCTFDVVVTDITNPVIAGCPTTITANALATIGTCGTTVSWTAPTVSDNCTVNMVSNKSPGDFFPVGTTPVTYTATDASGRQATCTFNVVVNDVTNPVITGCPSTITVNAVSTIGTCGTNVTWTPPTAADNCSVGLTFTSDKNPGDFFAVGTTPVTYTATDASGRTSTCTFNVVVNDVTNPVITGCPSAITVSAVATIGTCGTVVNWTPPTASDNCSVGLTLVSNKNPGDFFAVGTTAVTYTATDASGGQSTCTFNVIVNDVTNPVIAGCPSTITVNADATAGTCGTNVSWTPPTASDNCTTGLTLTSDKTPGQFFAVGTTAVTYTATDASGRTSTCTFNVVVNDVTNPVIANCPTTITVNADATTGTCGTNVSWTPPTVTDNCVVNMTSNKTPGQFFAVGTTAVTYTATDASGRTATCTFNVVVNDVTNPVITACPTTITVNANAAAGTCGTNVSWTAPTVTDNCVVNMTSNKVPGDFFTVGTTAVTYTATDASGRTATCTFNVVVNDVTNPIITGCPTTITVNAPANACDRTVTWTAPTVSDNCVVNMTSNKSPGSSFTVGTTAVTYTATDASGRTATCTFNVIVNDVTKPVISNCPSNISVTTSTCNSVVNWTPPTAADPCGVTLTSNFAPGATFPVGVTAVTYTATDPSGNSETCTFNVTVVDNVAPVISGCNPGTIQVNASGSCNAVATWTPPTATDNCSVIMTSTHTPGSTFPMGITDVIYTATDPSGNTSTCLFKVHVRDLTAPVFSGCIASNVTATATSSCGAVVSWTAPTATDNCSVEVTTTHAPGTSFPIGTTVVTYTAEDDAGNSVQCSFNVVVTDTSAPVVSACPANIQAQLTGSTCAINVSWTAPTFADNCAVTITSTHSPGDQFALGTTTVTYTAKDASDNTSTCSFNVVVTDASVPTILNCPTDITVTASSSCSESATWVPPTFVDNCSATIVGTHTPGQSFALGVTTVTYTVTDAAGNQATCSFKVNVVDSTLPVIQNCPNDITIAMDVGACGKAVSWTLPTATDNCSVNLTSNFAPGHVFPEGTTQVTYTATDGSGNIAACSFNVIVKDQTPPVVLTCPSDIEINASGSCDASANWTLPGFSDNCGPLTITSTHNPNATFAIGSTTVVYTATDASGNSVTCQFKVIVVDKSNPVITNCPANIVVSAGQNCSAIVTWTPPAASDNCQVAVTSSHQPGASFAFGTTRVNYTATDAAGNIATCSFDVTVVDDAAPIFTNCPVDVKVTATSCSATATWNAPVVSDCSNFTVTRTHDPGAEFPVGSTLITYTATDENGKSATCSFNVIVEDKSAPVFASCPLQITANATVGCDAQITWTAPIVADNCGIASVISSHEPGLFPVGISTVVYTATDVHGNISKCEFTVVVRNENPPVISNCPVDQVLKVTYEEGAVATWEEPNASVKCGQVALTSNYPSGHEFPVGETLVEYTALDDAGNSSTCSFIITVTYADLEFDVTKLVTPDGDGINDAWILSDIDRFRENRVTIFDRWGSVVFSASGYDNQNIVWKGGNASGGSVPTGTYFYTITVRFREDYVERKGFIEVVR